VKRALPDARATQPALTTSSKLGPDTGSYSSQRARELAKFHNPPAVRAEPESAPANTLGVRRIMFAVEDIDDVVARLRSRGAGRRRGAERSRANVSVPTFRLSPSLELVLVGR